METDAHLPASRYASLGLSWRSIEIGDHVELIRAIVYGIVQGLTEYLPISSTAHIRIIPTLFGWPDPGSAYTAVIQIGTIIAVLLYFGKDISHAVLAWFQSIYKKEVRNTPEAKLGWAGVHRHVAHHRYRTSR